MEKNEYLNEEQFKKNNKKVKVAGLIVLSIGIIMLIIGLFVIKVPEMGEDGWFELSSKSRKFKMFGIGLTIIGCMIRFVVGNQRSIMAYKVQEGMPIAKEGIEKMSPSMGTAAKEISKGIKEGMSEDNAIYCKYCGAQLDADSSFCKKCGKQL
ncbi:MAG: zinc ribbon domain-containing protein [Clostridia bacterium]|nr:zinc ribbon domain-containing protein [Clostridia bacterium]